MTSLMERFGPMRARTSEFMRLGLLELAAWMPFARGRLVEVGSYCGDSCRLFASTGKFDQIVCVDAWEGGYDDEHDAASRDDMAEVLNQFRRNTSGIWNVLPIRGRSLEVAPHFLPASVDAVYIDATHTYDGLKADIAAWSPIVRRGGVIAGHDYWEIKEWPGVNKAVDEAFGRPDMTFRDGSWAIVKR